MHDDHLIEDHDHGLGHDLQVMASRAIQRRRLLGMLASGGVATLVAACGGGDNNDNATTSGATTATTTTTGTTTTGTTTTGTTTGTTTSACVADPTETNGPYPSDGTNTVNGTVSNILTASGIVRSDIRTSFSPGSQTAAGVQVTLTLTLVNTNASCAVLSNYAVYVWHCDRSGAYSLYASSLLNENYLRGVQVSDANGQATFTTIFPGCYSGRYPHIHFEVYPSLATATTQKNAKLTSQLAMPSAVCSTVYAGATGYSQSVTNFAQISISSDNVFGDDTAAQIAVMTPTMTGSVSAGYTATATIGIAI